MINNVNNQIVKSNIQNQPSFGSTASLGKRIFSNPTLKKFSDAMEYDKFSMSIPAMMGILYGATIVPRYCQATDKHDRREILTRDVTSITAILFLAKALNKGFSRYFAKKSGFVLNNTPLDHGKNLLNRVKNYLNPSGGIDVLNSQELKLKYSNLKNYNEGIKGFFKFVDGQGGDIRKILASNKVTKENADKILGKDILKATKEEVETKLAKAEGSAELNKIYSEFEKPDNTFVKKAKTMNSTFDFLSTIMLTPALMIGIEKFNEHMTKKILAKEEAKKSKASDVKNA